MRSTKLVFVEGMPGSGKSTTAWRIADMLQGRGYASKLYRERQPDHPLNVGGDTHPSGSCTGEEFYRSYSPEAFIKESLARWESFVAEMLCEKSIAVLDSYPFQNSARVLLQLDASFERISNYAAQVEALVAPLNPVLIYLESGDPAKAFCDTCKKRGAEWTDYVVQVVGGCPYAEARKLNGVSAVAELLTVYKKLSDILLEQSSVPRLILEGCHNHWADCYRRIDEFLLRHLSSGSRSCGGLTQPK